MLGFLDKVLEYYYGNRTIYQTYITIMFFATWDAKIALSKPCLTLQFKARGNSRHVRFLEKWPAGTATKVQS
jgi:hypothetical protein